MKIVATLIKVDGTETETKPAHGATFQLKEMQAHVGGLIEVIRMGSRWVVMDEEGKRKGKAKNTAATHRVHDFLLPEDFLVGDILICEPEEMKTD